MDEFTGALMAFFTLLEVGAPFLILVFLRVYHEKRNRVFAGFFMVCFILFFLSFLLYPNWIIPFLRATTNNLRADFGFNIHTIFVHIWPSQGRIVAWIFITALCIILGYEWISARSGDYRRFYWASCLSLAIAPLLGFALRWNILLCLLFRLPCLCHCP
jgi:hypothetical protein